MIVLPKQIDNPNNKMTKDDIDIFLRHLIPPTCIYNIEEKTKNYYKFYGENEKVFNKIIKLISEDEPVITESCKFD